MSTRWFVEVSPVEAETLKERYCVEALQWQQALQQARKLRSDRGPVSRFAIELLDAAYRATDPVTRLRYTVSRAPEDAPLSGNGASSAAPAPPGAAEPAQPVAAPQAAPVATPQAAPPTHESAPVPAAAQPPLAAVAAPAPVAPHPPPGPSVIQSPAVEAAPIPLTSFVPRPQRGPEPAQAAAEVTSPLPLVSVKQPSAHPPPGPGRDASSEEPVPTLPGLELISVRREEPRAGNPITYREYAFCVEAGLTPHQVERYVRAIWEQVRATLASRPEGKLVQIALFDHRFEGRPARPPVGTLAWKDWRGDPQLQIQGMPQAAPPALQAAEVPVPAFPPPGPAPVAPREEPAAEPAPVSTEAPSVRVAEMSEEEVAAVSLPPLSVPVPASDAPPPEPAPAPQPAIELPRPPAPQISEAPRSSSAARRGSLAPIPQNLKRHAPTEDLIGDLFEQMHQLHFMSDLAAGAEYVLHALLRVVPSEGALVHVFDINSRQFVIVRAAGPGAGDALLLRTPDTFPLFKEAFRRSRTIVLRDVGGDDDRYRVGRFQTLGVSVSTALCGPVRQGGRYLGMLELVNPLGGPAFHDGEINAVDYICEQFADFVASKPVVLDADAIVPKA